MSSSTEQARRSQRNRPATTSSSSNSGLVNRASVTRRVRRTAKAPEPRQHPPVENNEEVGEDDLCPVCHLLLYSPVTTRCNHTLCKSCMAHWADVSVVAQMKIVDVDTEPVAFDAVSGLEAKCPMCRTQTTASLNPDLRESLAIKYPLTWAERQIEEEDPDAGNQSSIQTLTVYIGNRHRLVDPPEDETPNQHVWTFFVKPSRENIIEEVQIVLHPSFRPNRVVRQRAPYELQRLGWGTFTITAYVILKAGYTWVSTEAQNTPDGAAKGMLPLEWTLDFDGFGGKGSMGNVRLKVKNDREWRDVSSEEERDDREWQRTVRSYQRDGIYQPPQDD